MYINDLENGIKSSIRFFVDETSVCSTVNDPNSSAEELNNDLQQISQWAFQWKMRFNPDPTKPAEEIIFSLKHAHVQHPPHFFNNIMVKQVSEHKHLGLILDSKLTFANHISEKISKARKGIGVIKYLSSYAPVKTKFTKCMFGLTLISVMSFIIYLRLIVYLILRLDSHTG